MKTRIKKNIILIAVMLFAIISTNTIQAQHRGVQGPPKLPDSKQINKMVSELSKELSLNKDQETKISKIYFSHFDEAKKILETNRNNRELQRKKMDASNRNLNNKVNTALTKEQQKKYAKFLNKQELNRKRPPKPNR